MRPGQWLLDGRCGRIIAQFLCRHGCKAKLKHATRKTKLKNGNATERATTKAELENGNARTPKARTPNPDIVVLSLIHI